MLSCCLCAAVQCHSPVVRYTLLHVLVDVYTFLILQFAHYGAGVHVGGADLYCVGRVWCSAFTRPVFASDAPCEGMVGFTVTEVASCGGLWPLVA